jgi:hypothetical protein
MRKRGLFFLLILCGAIFISCVTAPSRPVLTVELFDWRPAGTAADPGSASAVTLPTPVPPDAIGAAALLKPGREVSIIEAGAQRRAPSAQSSIPMRLPVAPAVAAAPAADASLVPARRVTTAAQLTLPVPEAPGVKKAASAPVAASAAASAGRQAAGQAPKTAGAPAPAAAASGAPGAPASGGTAAAAAVSGAAASGAPGSGAAASGAPAASASAATAPSDSYGRLREIYARIGDDLQVGLEGTGFLFLGFPDSSSLADGMSFKGKENKNGKAYFNFKALKLGIYDLDFLQQDNVTGKSTKETVRVHVVSDQDFAAAMSSQTPGQPGGAVEAGDPAFASKLAGLGAYNDAIAELLKGYKEGVPGLNDQLASLYMKTGALEAAAKYYTKNIAPQNPYTRSAVLGMVRIAVAQKDQQGLMSYLKQFLSVTDPGAEEILIQAARMEKEKGEIGVGLDLAVEYATRFPAGRWRDEAEFLAAELLEADSSFRDIPRSRELYRDILATFPESGFAGAARDRLAYIERHFYQVR